MNATRPTASRPQQTAIDPLLRLRTVMEVTGLARSTIYRLVAEHRFPAPVKLAERAVAWRHDDVRTWVSRRASTSHAKPALAGRGG